MKKYISVCFAVLGFALTLAFPSPSHAIVGLVNGDHSLVVNGGIVMGASCGAGCVGGCVAAVCCCSAAGGGAAAADGIGRCEEGKRCACVESAAGACCACASGGVGVAAGVVAGFSGVGILAGLVTLDDKNPAAFSYPELTFEQAESIKMSPEELEAYTASLDRINALVDKLLPEALQAQNPTQAFGQLWTQHKNVLSPEALSAVQKVAADVWSEAQQAK